MTFTLGCKSSGEEILELPICKFLPTCIKFSILRTKVNKPLIVASICDQKYDDNVLNGLSVLVNLVIVQLSLGVERSAVDTIHQLKIVFEFIPAIDKR